MQSRNFIAPFCPRTSKELKEIRRKKKEEARLNFCKRLHTELYFVRQRLLRLLLKSFKYIAGINSIMVTAMPTTLRGASVQPALPRDRTPNFALSNEVFFCGGAEKGERLSSLTLPEKASAPISGRTIAIPDYLRPSFLDKHRRFSCFGARCEKRVRTGWLPRRALVTLHAYAAAM